MNHVKNSVYYLTPIITIELCDYQGIDFMGSFLISNGYSYILVTADYVSK